MKKKIISLVLAMLMVFTSVNVPVFALTTERETKIFVDTSDFQDAVYQEGETLKIPVKISGNPGFASYVITAHWNEADFDACAPLYEVGSVIPGGATFMSGKNAVAVGYVDTYDNGTLFYICLKAKRSVHDSEISVGFDPDQVICNSKPDALEVELVPATISLHKFDGMNTDSEYLASEATCTNRATYFYSCACGKKGTETFESGNLLEHTYNQKNTDAMYLASEATCTAKATYYYSCECGEKGTETFEYGGLGKHNFVDGYCTVCDEIDDSMKFYFAV